MRFLRAMQVALLALERNDLPATADLGSGFRVTFCLNSDGVTGQGSMRTILRELTSELLHRDLRIDSSREPLGSC